MTEVSHAWLDRVVTARQRLADINTRRFALQKLMKVGDVDYGGTDEAATILMRDGTHWRAEAILARVLQLTSNLNDAERTGSSVGPIMLGLTEVADALEETILNTEALLADVGQAEDPFIDRLEEHPTYERD